MRVKLFIHTFGKQGSSLKKELNSASRSNFSRHVPSTSTVIVNPTLWFDAWWQG